MGNLTGREIHVHPVRLEAPDDLVAAWWRTLAADEAERAGRFRFDHLRRRFILARGALRHLLAGYLGTRPEAITFRYGAKGKPALAGAADLYFSVSHSGDVGLLAFTLGRELGVDIERLRPVAEMSDIATRMFAPEEAGEVLSLAEAEREAAFFRCWTRKEAYLKAVGDGLSAPLDGFRVTLLPGVPARFIHVGGDEVAALAWTLHDLTGLGGHIAALAYRDAPRPLLVAPMATAADLA